MFVINKLLPSSASEQQIDNASPHELKIKIFGFLPVKTLAILRLVSLVWKTFIDTHFPEVFSRQFLFILQKYPIADPNEKNHFSRFAVKKIAANDFEQALELEKNLEGSFLAKQTLDDLVKNADSKEKILKLFEHFLNRRKELSYNFLNSIKPLIKRYFSILASLIKEKQESIVDNFNEALSVLKKFHVDQETHLLIGLYLMETYPEYVKNQQNAVFDSLQLNDNCFQYIETRAVVEIFSYPTFLNFLVVAKFFPKKHEEIPYLFERITSRKDALAFLQIGGRDVQKFIKYQEIYTHLNFFDLLEAAAVLLEEIDTYQFYRKILKRAESAGEFEIGLQKLLERKPKEEQLKDLRRVVVSIILEETPSHLLSFGVYEILLHYPDKVQFAKAFLRIASICEKRLCKTIVARVKRMPELNDGICTNIMALEIELGEFERAKQTFCSIKIPEWKYEAATQLTVFIEKEEWDYFDICFKELYVFFNQEKSEGGIRIFRELIQQIAKKDVKRALNLVKSNWTGYLRADFLIIIAEEQKEQKADFLPLVFEARSLITSLVTSNKDATHALNLLTKLWKLQSDE